MSNSKQLPILFFAFANEKEDGNAYLRNLAIEQREIREALQKVEDNEIAEIEIRYNVSLNDIFDFFQHDKNRGRIVLFHYAGHANSFQFLLENEDGTNQIAHGEGLLEFFKLQQSLKIVILNGCSTENHAIALAQSGIATIATSNSIDDGVATTFASRLYNAIANKTPFQQAFDETVSHLKTIKGTANFRDFYWDGMEETQVTDKFPWELYPPNNWPEFNTWTIQEAYDKLNITLAEKARRAYLALRKTNFDTSSLETKVDTIFKRGDIKKAIKLLIDSFDDTDANLKAYILDLAQQYKKVSRDAKRFKITQEQFEIALGKIKVAIQELLEN